MKRSSTSIAGVVEGTVMPGSTIADSGSESVFFAGSLLGAIRLIGSPPAPANGRRGGPVRPSDGLIGLSMVVAPNLAV